MFGTTQEDQQVTVGAPTVQNPSMLDNVTPNDFNNTNQQNQPSNQPFSSFNNPATAPPQATSSTINNAASTANPTSPATNNPFADNAVDASPTPAVQSVSTSNSSVTTPVTENSTTPQVTIPSEETAAPIMPTDNLPTTTTMLNDDDEDEGSQSPSAPIDPEKLADMKQQALKHLEPLVNHISQDPEEEFKTTMMMIQANDNHTLLEKALEAAKKIEDDKIRANALLDIINEINYFSQNGNVAQS